VRDCVPDPPHESASQALQDPYWVPGQETVGLLQLCVCVQVEDTHEPPEHSYSVTVRDCVPDPPHESASQALQDPYWVPGQETAGMVQLRDSDVVDAWQPPLAHAYVVKVRHCVPEPPQASASQALQLP
jgi:hypothetical protein